MARTALGYFRNAAPGALDRLPRTYSAFDLPAAFERVKFSLEVRGNPNGCVVLNGNAFGPHGAFGFDLISSSQLTLCGDRDAGRLFKAFFAGETSLAIIADWIEDDMADRVKDVRRHWISAHRMHEDDVYHFLTLMRCYRDGRKNKSPLPPPTF